LTKLLGGGVDPGAPGGLTERSISTIEERIKQKNKTNVAAPLLSPSRRGTSMSNQLAIATAAAQAAADIVSS